LCESSTNPVKGRVHVCVAQFGKITEYKKDVNDVRHLENICNLSKSENKHGKMKRMQNIVSSYCETKKTVNTRNSTVMECYCT